jgi:hypothetical protein
MTSEEASGEKIVENLAKGAVKGAAEFTAEKISELVEKFKQGNLAFIEDPETISLVKKQLERPEWDIFNKYVKDKEVRLMIQMGFVLRKLERDPIKLRSLRDKIYKKYETKGLNIAELVQSGVFTKYANILLEEANTVSEFEEGIEQILHDIEKYTEFVKADSDVNGTSYILSTRINSILPKGIILFSSGEVSMSKAAAIVDQIKQNVLGYRFENQVNTDVQKRYDFVIRVTKEGTILGDHLP